MGGSASERARVSRTNDALDSTLKAFNDQSAEERFYNRSVRIRRKIMKWLMEHVGDSWQTYAEMDAEAGNYAGCHMTTAHRWIFQYTRKDKPFEIQETTDAVILRERQVIQE